MFFLCQGQFPELDTISNRFTPGECQKLSAEAVAAQEQHDTGRETWNVVPVAFHLSLWTPFFVPEFS